MTRRLAVIGDPVAHSLSPRIHNVMLRVMGLPEVYGAVRVPPGETPKWLEQARAENYLGFNATMPHKMELLPQMDWLDADAARFGAVNTVCLREGRAYGYNTDGAGFLRAVKELKDPAGRNIVLLGTGGAARAVGLKLADSGAGHITVCGRRPERTEELCTQAPEVMSPAGFSPEELAAACDGADLLVNATSLGMSQVEGQFEDFCFLDALSPAGAVYDVIYSPAETMLLREGRHRGLAAANGLSMLIWQAIFALGHFLGRELDGERLYELVRCELDVQ